MLQSSQVSPFAAFSSVQPHKKGKATGAVGPSKNRAVRACLQYNRGDLVVAFRSTRESAFVLRYCARFPKGIGIPKKLNTEVPMALLTSIDVRWELVRFFRLKDNLGKIRWKIRWVNGLYPDHLMAIDNIRCITCSISKYDGRLERI